jgi:flagellin
MASITINTNLASLTAQRNLSKSTTGMNTAMERLTTGFRINSGKDDAAGAAVSNLMEAQISAYDVAESNTTMGLTLLDTAEGVLDIVGDYIQRIRDLTEQAANGTYGTSSMNAIRTEVEQRMLEIDRLCSVVDFNGIQLLDGTSTAAQGGGLNLQVGNNAGSANIINLDASIFKSAKCSALLITANEHCSKQKATWYDRSGYDATEKTTALKNRIGRSQETVDGVTYNYTNAKQITAPAGSITAICDAVYTDDRTAREFLYFLDDAIENISARSALIGAYMNRVESAVDAISVQKENIVSANSSIKDADVAEESSNYIKYQILQQSSATLLSTANQQPQIALNLL